MNSQTTVLLFQWMIALSASILVYGFVAFLFDLDPKDILKTFFNEGPRKKIRQWLSEQNHEAAGNYLLELGQPHQAIEIFKQGNLFAHVAKVSESLKDPVRAARYYEKALEYPKASQLYLQTKKYSDLKRVMQKLGQSHRMGQLLFQSGEYTLSARSFLQDKDFESAAKSLLKADKPFEASISLFRAYEEVKNKLTGFSGKLYHPESKTLGVNAAKLFKFTRQFKRAAKLFRELQMREEAAACYAEIGDFKSAAQLFEDLGAYEQAVSFWKKAGEHSRATKLDAERLAHRGEWIEAAERFIQAGDFARAGDVYCELRDTFKAAQMYEKAGDPALAGIFYRQAGKFELAGQAFEKAQSFEQAIDSYKQAQMVQKEFSLRLQIKDYIGLSKRYLELQMYDLALQTLDDITQSHVHYKTALALKGKVLMLQGHTQEAQAEFSKSKRIEGPIDEDTDAWLQLASRTSRSSPAPSLTIPSVTRAPGMAAPHTVVSAPEQESQLPSMDAVLLQAQKTVEAQAFPSHTNRYVKSLEIGRGGMGIVYKAKDTTLDRWVALKILPPSLSQKKQAVHTFLREARATAALNHPGIVTVYDTGIQDGDYYIAMEFIEGQTVRELLKKRTKLPLKEALPLIEHILEALAYAHSKNVVHRDLTTSNVMITRHGQPKIMDFGLAKIMKELLSEQSIIGGTPSFMSPEQTTGDPIDHRTDLYSLGISIFEMCLGQLPFQKGDMGYHHLHTLPPSPLDIDPTLPQALSDLILRCLQKKQIDRFQSADEMLHVIKSISLG